MLQRLTLSGALLIVAVIALSACGGGGNQAPIPDPGAESAILLPSGGGAVFPAGSFDAATEVEVNEELTGGQRDASTFPANSGALLGSTTVKVPAGVALNRDIEVRIAVSPPQATNMSFTIFEYNNATRMWETAAGASSAGKDLAAAGAVTGGSIVSFDADTAGATGLDVTYGVFENFGTATGGGGGEQPEPNQIPTVTVSADDTSVDPGDTVTLTATGNDPDGDALTFSWMAAGGMLGTPNTTGGTSTNTWSADTGGAYTVSVSVNDGNGGVATDAVNIGVTVEGGGEPPVNDPPEFEGDITGDVAAPVVGQKVWLTATAHDPEEGEVTFEWSGPGSFTDPTVDEHGARVFWTPDAEGSQTATCTASDPAGNETTADYTATVAAMPAAFDFVGYNTCLACHSDKGEKSSSALGGTGWFSTAHSDAIQRNLGPDNAHGYRNPSCYNCHALGWNPNDQGQGFIDIDLTPEYANIQCETCHGGGNPAGMGSGHKGVAWNPLVGMLFDEVEGKWLPDDDFDASMGIGCGACHEGSRHGSVEEWAESWHASFVNTEDDGGTEVPNHKLTGDSCAKCHNGQEYVRVQIKGEAPEDVELTLDDLPDVYISCATCHDPHDAQYEAQLRVDSEGQVGIPFSAVDNEPTMVSGGKGNICITCHNGRRDRGDYDTRVWEGSGHFGPHGNPQGAMFFGVMGADLGDPPAPVTYEYEHPHLTWNENTCVTCHMYRRDYISSDEPALWGHTFEAQFERCITCHTNFTIDDQADFWLWVEDYQAEIEDLLQEFRDAWPAAWLDGDGEPNNRDTDPATGVGPPREDAVGAAYRAALWNYALVQNDATMGVHNPTFTVKLIEEAIASLAELPAP